MEITRDEIVYVLKNRKSIIRRFRKLMDDIEIIRLELLSSSTFIPSATSHISDISGRKGGCNDLQKVLDQTERCVNEYIQTFYLESLYVVEENARLNRIMTCLHTLPSDEFNVIYDVYIKKKMWEEVQKEYAISRGTLSKRLAHGICMIQELYESDYTVQTLIRMRGGNYDTRRKK